MLESALSDEDKSGSADKIIVRLTIWKNTHLICLERLYNGSNDISNGPQYLAEKGPQNVACAATYIGKYPRKIPV